MTADPRMTALLDQTGAAGKHAYAVLQNLARRERTRVRYRDHRGPITDGIVRRLSDAIRASSVYGAPILCQHLSFTAPTVAFAAPHAGGRLWCAPCMATLARRTIGTDEDSTCDGCRTRVPRIHPAATQLPALVADPGDGYPPGALPPVVLLYGLCPGCLTADGETP